MNAAEKKSFSVYEYYKINYTRQYVFQIFGILSIFIDDFLFLYKLGNQWLQLESGK